MAVNMEIERRLFGTDGVRWIVDRESIEFVLKLAYAIASYFPSGSRALVGMDGRIGNPAIYGTVISALAASGSKVYDTGFVPTPALQLCVRDLGFDYGIVVTASHNPPEWVGIKVVLNDGIEAPPEVDKQIEEIFFSNKFRRVPWYNIKPIEKFDTALIHYIESVKKHIDSDIIKRKKPKIVVDCANSVSSLTTPRILKELGAKVLSINCDIGIPYRTYEPTPDSLQEIMEIVRSIGADFGIAHDGDGDRAVLIDEKGRFVAGDVSAIILTNYVAKKNLELPKRVVTAISTSHFLVRRNIVEKGIDVAWTRVGFLNIARKIKELGGALSGFEDNGGFAYVPHQLVRDGSMTAALVAEMISNEGKSISRFVDEIEKPVIIRTKISVASREKSIEIIDRIRDSYINYNRIEIDGVKVITDSYAFIVRPSGTEPLIRITVEAWHEDIAKKVLNEVISIAQKSGEKL